VSAKIASGFRAWVLPVMSFLLRPSNFSQFSTGVPGCRTLARFVPYLVEIAVVPLLLATLSFPLGLQQPSASSQQKADLSYRQGMEFLRQKQYRVALEKFREVERSAPTLPQGYTGEGIALALTGRLKDAVTPLQRALGIDPSYWVARRELGIIEWQLDWKDEAARNLAVIHKLFPEDPPVNLILGEYNFAEKKYELASEYFAKVPAQVATSLRLSFMASEALLKTGRLKDAAANLEALSFTPNLAPQDRLKIAWMLGEATDYSRAIQLFNSLPAAFPDPFGRGYGLALAYYNEGRYSECIDTLTALERMRTVRAELFGLLGAAEERSGNTQGAYNAFREGIRQFPHDDEDYLNIATVAVKHVSYLLAIQVLDAGLAVIPDDDKLLMTRGVVNTLRSNLQTAEADYEKALSLAPTQSSIYVGLGICLMDLDNYDAAAAILRHAIQRGVRDETVYYFLADALYRRGLAPSSPSYEEAMNAVQASLKLDPGFAYGYLEQGRLELLGGDVQKAVDDLEHATRLVPRSRSVLYELATAYRLEGRKAEAERLFARVSESGRQEDRQFRRGKLVQMLRIVPHENQDIK
jgi:tetratricopeptide (TPR) repeat protein